MIDLPDLEATIPHSLAWPGGGGGKDGVSQLPAPWLTSCPSAALLTLSTGLSHLRTALIGPVRPAKVISLEAQPG